MPLNLCPPPCELVSHGGVCLPPRGPCRVPEPWLRGLQHAVDELKLPFELSTGSGDCQLSINDELAPEAYRLATGDCISMEAADENGARHALITLASVMAESPQGELPIISIDDQPSFSARGFMLDISRCKVPTMESLRQMVRQLALLKFNQVQLYIEHTFRFSEHEAVWRDASPMTAEEIRNLDQYCSTLGIELVPNLNSFGHMERWLRHSDYHHLAECPDGFDKRWGGWSPWGSTLKPDTESLSFMSGLYDEFLPCFKSPLFNVGCDETWELGQGASAKKCSDSGTTQIYLEYLKGIHRLSSERDRRMMFWGDIILHKPELISALPSGVIAMNWGYEADHPFEKETAAFAEAGVPFYVCPGTSSWNSLVGRVGNAFENIRCAAEQGAARGASGMLLTDWGDGGHHQYWPFSWPGVVAASVKFWNSGAAYPSDLGSIIDRIFETETSGTGALIIECGRACEKTGAAPANSNVFHHLLFKGGVPEADREAVSLERLQQTSSVLKELKEQAIELAGLTGEEICNGLDMAMHAVHLGLGVFESAPAEFDDTAGRKNLCREHERLWMARNRPGGLAESLSVLRGIEA